MARKSQRVRRRVSAPFAAQSRPPCWPYGPVSRSSQAQSPTRALYPAAWRGHFPHTPPSPPPSPPPPPPPRPLPPNVHCKYAGVERHWTNSNSTSNRSCSAHTHTPHDAAAPRTETPPPTTPHSRRRRRRRPSAAAPPSAAAGHCHRGPTGRRATRRRPPPPRRRDGWHCAATGGSQHRCWPARPLGLGGGRKLQAGKRAIEGGAGAPMYVPTACRRPSYNAPPLQQPEAANPRAREPPRLGDGITHRTAAATAARG